MQLEVLHLDIPAYAAKSLKIPIPHHETLLEPMWEPYEDSSLHYENFHVYANTERLWSARASLDQHPVTRSCVYGVAANENKKVVTMLADMITLLMAVRIRCPISASTILCPSLTYLVRCRLRLASRTGTSRRPSLASEDGMYTSSSGSAAMLATSHRGGYHGRGCSVPGARSISWPRYKCTLQNKPIMILLLKHWQTASQDCDSFYRPYVHQSSLWFNHDVHK